MTDDIDQSNKNGVMGRQRQTTESRRRDNFSPDYVNSPMSSKVNNRLASRPANATQFLARHSPPCPLIGARSI